MISFRVEVSPRSKSFTQSALPGSAFARRCRRRKICPPSQRAPSLQCRCFVTHARLYARCASPGIICSRAMCPESTSECLVAATARQEALSATREKLALVEPRSKTLQAELDASRRENAKLLERCADLEKAAKQGRALSENGSKHAEELATLKESCAALRAQVPTAFLVCLRTVRPRMRHLI